ncbi:hypothetical protein M8312_13160 [Sphingomonas sp. KRR8]|uniref:hypothetical protein n=1 Tax=Sphingomonas sp. KRR8 TaxID=2942996 RepID=UPI00202249E8|nr:hypothetical protein [Sphingomonas sp. KRR8]URD60708.1 hypothetical protein M8312_13160 [Sphingomonas sp. KRR8]
MNWTLRRIVGPLALGTVLGTVALLVWTMWGRDVGGDFRLDGLAVLVLFVFPFQIVGLALLLPVALLLCDMALPRPLYGVLLPMVGALLGVAVVLPIVDRAPLLDSALPAACGAMSSIAWLAFNRDAIRRKA